MQSTGVLCDYLVSDEITASKDVPVCVQDLQCGDDELF